MQNGSHLDTHERDERRDVSPVESEQHANQSNSIRGILLFALIILVIVLPIRLFVAKPFIVSGTSMYPTFDTWHYLIIDQLTYRFDEPQRGDVVVFRFPQNPSRFFIKRIIALPEETITLNGNEVRISNEAHPEGFILDEPYLSPDYLKGSQLTTTLGDDEYFVMGDNRKASADSRYWGPLELDRIVGRAYVRLFPFTTIDILPGSTMYAEPLSSTNDAS